MNRPTHTLAIGFVVGCTALLPLAARAQQQAAADALYNDGVQAYFRGSSAEADSSLSRLIGVDSNDPRAFYFRALSRMAQGRENEARMDMQTGAQIEARVPHRFDMGKTLERVQGPTRLLLERYRSRAHQAAALNPPRGAVRSADTTVLRERRVVPVDQFWGTGQPQSFAAPEPVQEALKPPAPSITPPAQTSAPAVPSNPFGDDATASPAPKAQPKVPPAKPAARDTQPAAIKLPPAPKPTPPAPKQPIEVEKDENPF